MATRHSPNAIFEKNVTRLATFARVIRHSRKFGASGHCLVFLQITEQNKIDVFVAIKLKTNFEFFF